MLQVKALLAVFLMTFALAGDRYKVTVRGGDATSFLPGKPKPYDVIIVGAGLAGLSAAVYLTDQNLKVLLLEKEASLGGLAAGSTVNGISYDRGAAYFTRPYEEEQKILEHMGFGNFEDNAIHSPIDSYLWKGRFYENMWEGEKTMEALPAAFSIFQEELKTADADGKILNQPLELVSKLPKEKSLDEYFAEDWIREMPYRFAERNDEESRAIYKRFVKETGFDAKQAREKFKKVMNDVVDFLDLYGRSALGTTMKGVSALAFANFYISEIETRYTTPLGTGALAKKMQDILEGRKELATLKPLATVTAVVPEPQGVRVEFNFENTEVTAHSSYLVFAAQLKFAANIIQGFAEKRPNQVATIRGIHFTDYAVHNVFVKGHPYRATYDTWVKAEDAKDTDFTDVINSRWQDDDIRGYEGMRDFKSHPKDDEGKFAIYHQLTEEMKGKGDAHAIQIATQAVDRMVSLFNPFLKKQWGTQMEVVAVETNRWPFSIHVAPRGYFTHTVPEIRKPFGRIYFAHSNLGTPTFEEALFRGHCAANNILAKLQNRPNEPWSRCIPE